MKKFNNFRKITSLLHYLKRIIYFEDIINYFFIDYCILYCIVIHYIKKNLEQLDNINHNNFITGVLIRVIDLKKRNLIFFQKKKLKI